MYKPKSLFNRFFIFAWIIGLTLGIGQSLYNSIITVFATSSGYSTTFAGSLSMGYLVGALLGRRLGGWTTDMKGRRIGVIIGTSAFLAATVIFCLSIAHNGIVMMFLRFAHGFGYGCATTAYYVMVEDVVPPEKASVGLGINFTGAGIAFAFSGVMISLCVTGDSYTLLFEVTAAFLAVAVLFSFAETYEKGHPVIAQRKKKDKNRKFLEPAAVPYAVIVLFYNTAISLPMFYLVPLAQYKKIEDWSFLFTCIAIGMIAGYLIFPRIAGKLNSFFAMLPVYVSGLIGLLLFLYTKNDTVFNLCGILCGMTLASVPVMQHAAVEHVSEDRKGNATSTLNSAIDLTMGVGPLIWGILIDLSGYSFPYILGAVLFVIASVVHFFVEKKQSNTV